MTITSSPPRAVHEFATVSMDTLVHVNVVSDWPRASVEPIVQRALDWFTSVEGICSRFDPESEVMRLSRRVNRPVRVSTLLLELVAFALDLAKRTEGAFDPTIGAALEQRGISTNYRTGQRVHSGIDPDGVTYRDVRIDHRSGCITLCRPLVLDLNSVAKGLAIDLAARELAVFADFSVEAGGDLYLSGHNSSQEPWHVGLQHPRADGLLARTLRVSDAAVCTSGDYERHEHVLDARTQQPVADLASVTVVAATALAADGLSTAAMVLGGERGLAFLESVGTAGLMVASDGSLAATSALEEFS
jgi:thiamine biosynthesis lipoprotein